jgi:exodeoxyribonuclease VII small subunit
VSEELSFEQAMERLEQVVKELESGDLPLERSLALFQEGIGLARSCGVALDEAEAKVERLMLKNGQLVVAPLQIAEE